MPVLLMENVIFIAIVKILQLAKIRQVIYFVSQQNVSRNTQVIV